MKVPLTIQPNFLRARQAMARKRLLGQPIQPKVITPTIVFVQPQTPQTTANPQKIKTKAFSFPIPRHAVYIFSTHQFFCDRHFVWSRHLLPDFPSRPDSTTDHTSRYAFRWSL